MCTKEKSSLFEKTDRNSNKIVEEKCAPKCSKCEVSKDNCTECAPGLNRKGLEQDNCNCLEGFHDNNGILKDCVPC